MVATAVACRQENTHIHGNCNPIMNAEGRSPGLLQQSNAGRVLPTIRGQRRLAAQEPHLGGAAVTAPTTMVVMAGNCFLPEKCPLTNDRGASWTTALSPPSTLSLLLQAELFWMMLTASPPLPLPGLFGGPEAGSGWWGHVYPTALAQCLSREFYKPHQSGHLKFKWVDKKIKEF